MCGPGTPKGRTPWAEKQDKLRCFIYVHTKDANFWLDLYRQKDAPNTPEHPHFTCEMGTRAFIGLSADK